MKAQAAAAEVALARRAESSDRHLEARRRPASPPLCLSAGPPVGRPTQSGGALEQEGPTPPRVSPQAAVREVDAEVSKIRNLPAAERAKQAKMLRARYHPDKAGPALRPFADDLAKHVNAATDFL